MPFWTRVSFFFVKMRTSRCVEMRLSRLELKIMLWSRQNVGLVFWSRKVSFRQWLSLPQNTSLAFRTKNVGLLFWSWQNASLTFWGRQNVGLLLNADLRLPKRDAGVNLAFWIYRIDDFCRIFDLLSMCVMPSSTFSISVESQKLLGTTSNLKLQSLERRRTVELFFTITLIVYRRTGPTSLLRDVDTGCIGCMRSFQNLFRSGTACL